MERNKEFEDIWQMYMSDTHDNNYFIAIQMFKATEYTLMQFCEWLYDTYCDHPEKETVLFNLRGDQIYFSKIITPNTGQHIENLKTYRIMIVLNYNGGVDVNAISDPEVVCNGEYGIVRENSIKMIYKALYFIWKY